MEGVQNVEFTREAAQVYLSPWQFMRVTMPWQGTEKFAFGIFTVLEKAPAQSGVYALFAGERWVYIGASENIQVHLLTHLNGPDLCILQYDVTSFAYESIPAETCGGRQEDLIKEFRPVCRGGEGPNGGAWIGWPKRLPASPEQGAQTIQPTAEPR